MVKKALSIFLVFILLFSGCKKADEPAPIPYPMVSGDDVLRELEGEKAPVEKEDIHPNPAHERDEPPARPMGKVWLSKESATPGDITVLYAMGNSEIFSFTDMFGVLRDALPVSDTLSLCLIPIPTDTAPGEYPLSVTFGGELFEGVLTVEEKVFYTQRVEFPPDMYEKTMGSEEANEMFSKVMAPLKEESESRALWEGPFFLPLYEKYNLTTEFGLERTYVFGDKEIVKRHNAWDMATAEGTPVYAVGAGRVLFSDMLPTTGNTVLIDHGLGLKTWYFHLSSLAVSSGETVKRGQYIGAVGSTGLSTGAHLHFALSVFDTEVNPALLYSGEIIDPAFLR